MKRHIALFVVAMLLVWSAAVPAFAVMETQVAPNVPVEGILLATHSNTSITGKLHFGINGNWVHLRDFICPASFPRCISPDNRYLVGTGSVYMEPIRIYLWDLVKDKMEVIGEQKFYVPNTEMHFSPQGDKVLFYSGTPEIRWDNMPIEGIYQIELATRTITQVTIPYHKSRVENARWSANGEQILYVEWFYNDEMCLYPDHYIGAEIRAHNVLTGQTKTIVKMDNSVNIEGFEVVPDSNQLVINLSRRDGNYQLMLYDGDTGKQNILLSTPIPYGTVSPVNQLAVSPKGDKMAYSLYLDDSGVLNRLVVIDLRDKTQTVIADNVGSSWYGLDPVWSPDGRGLLYAVPDNGDKCEALAVVPDIAKPVEKELFYAEQQIYFYTWVTPASKQIAFKGRTGISQDVVGYNLWASHLKRYTPLGTAVMRKGDLVFELSILPSTTPEYSDRLALDMVVRKNGRLVKSEDLEGTIWAWVGDTGYGREVSLYKGHNLINDFYDPKWGRITIEFEGTYAGQPVKVRGSLGLNR